VRTRRVRSTEFCCGRRFRRSSRNRTGLLQRSQGPFHGLIFLSRGTHLFRTSSFMNARVPRDNSRVFLPAGPPPKGGSAKYVPPYDRREQHLPGMNFCGPGTNVRRRLANKVQPIDALDKLCLSHDIWTEPRGPYRSRGKRDLLRAADRRLLKGTLQLQKSGYQPAWKAAVVITAMELLLTHGGRGR